MSVKWLRKLKETYPELGQRAEYLNEIDNFVMYGSEKKQENTENNSTDCEGTSSDDHNRKKLKSKHITQQSLPLLEGYTPI